MASRMTRKTILPWSRLATRRPATLTTTSVSDAGLELGVVSLELCGARGHVPVVDVRLLAGGAQRIELGAANREGIVLDERRIGVGRSGISGDALLVGHRTSG